MKLEIPFEIGDRIIVDGKIKYIHGIHVWITKDATVNTYRLYLGDGMYVTVEA